ncbi:MAG: hypothetical protein MR355_00675 [Lachnospiraceae bacterium]|nr:hypothetical protein [Lachnospiraceae bacterium]
MAAKRKPKTLGKHIDKDIELCRTTNPVVSNELMHMFIAYEIPFTQNWQRVPFLKREEYKGAREVCVIRTHRTQYSRARKILDHMETSTRSRIMLHAV